MKRAKIDSCPTCSGFFSKQKLEKIHTNFLDKDGKIVLGMVYKCKECDYAVSEHSRTRVKIQSGDLKNESDHTLPPVEKSTLDTLNLRNKNEKKQDSFLTLPKVQQGFFKIPEAGIKTGSAKPSFSITDNIRNSRLSQLTNYSKIKIDWSPIIGYEEIKTIIDASLNSSTKHKKKTHVLIGGAPGTSKTVFLKTIQESLESQGVPNHYLDATTLTSSGVITYLFDNEVNNAIIAIDELDKLEKEHQAVFLNMLESGLLKVTKHKNIREKQLTNTLFLATANYIDKLMVPLLTRFLVLHIPEYTKEQFFAISIELLQKQYHKTEDVAKYITSEIWRIFTEIRHENPNMRQCVQVAVITENDKKQIDKIIKGLTTYGKKYE